MNALVRAWYQPRPGWAYLLLPVAWLFALLVWLRRKCYQLGWLASDHPGVPVIVIGNITVGGTGKTPLVATVAQQLKARGQRVGIVSRGYGGAPGQLPITVSTASKPSIVGDEPLLLAQHTGCPVVVCRDRLAAARHLVTAHEVDIIVADDGMQHYALARDAEIAVCDARRGYGNGHSLPVGPLREPLSRLRTVNLAFSQGEQGDYTLRGDWIYPVTGHGEPRRLSEFLGAPVHAVAGIGDPERFFKTLREAGLSLQTHAFADHHAYQAQDYAFDDSLSVLMTEKDAVKCRSFAQAHWWYLSVNAELTRSAQQQLDALFDRVLENP